MIFRWVSLFALLGCLGTSAYLRHRARREGQRISRRAEGALFMAVRGIVAIPLLLCPIAYVANPAWMNWASFRLPTSLRWLGVVLGMSAVPTAQWVFRSLGRNVSETVLTKEGHELVTIGPYRWVRHPLYATGIALFLSIGLMAANWFIILFVVIATVLMRLVVVPLEERELLHKFGDEYLRYIERTGRFLPRIALRTGGAL